MCLANNWERIVHNMSDSLNPEALNSILTLSGGPYLHIIERQHHLTQWVSWSYLINHNFPKLDMEKMQEKPVLTKWCSCVQDNSLSLSSVIQKDLVSQKELRTGNKDMTSMGTVAVQLHDCRHIVASIWALILRWDADNNTVFWRPDVVASTKELWIL